MRELCLRGTAMTRDLPLTFQITANRVEKEKKQTQETVRKKTEKQKGKAIEIT